MLNHTVLSKTSFIDSVSRLLSSYMYSVRFLVVVFFVTSLVLLLPKNTYAQARLIKDKPDSIPMSALLIEEQISATSGSVIEVPISFYGSEYDITAALLNVEFDSSVFEFDPRDYDGNGVPDSVTFHVPDGWRVLAFPGVPNQEIELILFDNGASSETLPDGVIATVRLQIKATITGQAIADVSINQGELVNSFGQLLAPTTSGTTVQVAAPQLVNVAYLPIIQ